MNSPVTRPVSRSTTPAWLATLLATSLIAACNSDDVLQSDSSARKLSSFSVAWTSGTPGTAVGVIDDESAQPTIAIDVPIGTNNSALIASFVTSGDSVAVGGTVQTSGTTANDLRLATTYTVTADDGQTRTYIVTVTTVGYVNALGTDDTAHGTAGAAGAFRTLQYALNDSRVMAGDTIRIAAGTYTEIGQIVIAKSVNVVGADKATTIIKPAQDTGNFQDTAAWILVNPGMEFNLSGVTLDGAGHLINAAVLSHGFGTVADSNISNIKYNESGPDYMGRGLVVNERMDVLRTTFTGIGRIGIHFRGGDGTVEGNTFIGKGAGNWLDYALDINRGSTVEMIDNTMTDHLGAGGGATSGAVIVGTYFSPGTTLTLSGNTFLNNSVGLAVGYDAADTATVLAHDNTFSGNGTAVTSTAQLVDARNNWWGSATGPFHATLNASGTGNPVGENVAYAPWLNVAL